MCANMTRLPQDTLTKPHFFEIASSSNHLYINTDGQYGTHTHTPYPWPRRVGLFLAVARGAAPPASIRLALDPQRDLAVPVAPAGGLLMAGAFFDGYCRSVG
jgi:hypothetical protein